MVKLVILSIFCVHEQLINQTFLGLGVIERQPMHIQDISLQRTNSDGLHDSTAAPIAVGCHNTDSVHYTVRQDDWNTCCIGGQEREAWSNSDGVVDWSTTIILRGVPLHCKNDDVLAIVQNSGREDRGRRRETCSNSSITNSEMSARTVFGYHTCRALCNLGRKGDTNGALWLHQLHYNKD